MMLYRSAGLEAFIGEDDAPPEVDAILSATARAFFDAGGVPSLIEWAELDNRERAALVNAKKRQVLGEMFRAARIELGDVAGVVEELDPNEAAELRLAAAVKTAARGGRS